METKGCPKKKFWADARKRAEDEQKFWQEELAKERTPPRADDQNERPRPNQK